MEALTKTRICDGIHLYDQVVAAQVKLFCNSWYTIYIQVQQCLRSPAHVRWSEASKLSPKIRRICDGIHLWSGVLVLVAQVKPFAIADAQLFLSIYRSSGTTNSCARQVVPCQRTLRTWVDSLCESWHRWGWLNACWCRQGPFLSWAR